jgi:hypothetical protein
MALGCANTSIDPRISVVTLLSSPDIPTGGMPMPSFHTKGTPTGTPTGPLQPGQYWWRPDLAPEGVLVILVSTPLQTLHVYRNGFLIGRTSISTGSPGHSTPGGVYTILEKRRIHYSSTYDNAPMPNMQRLTWAGVAMHSGYLPGYPASHGCIRMPYDFSQLLFQETSQGGTVVIGDGKKPVPYFASDPGLLLSPEDQPSDEIRPLATVDFYWDPGRAPTGPITAMVSAADRTIYVYRKGYRIGRAPIDLIGQDPLGDHVFSLLAATPTHGEEARPWMAITTGGAPIDPLKLALRLQIDPKFTKKLRDAITPGATIIITDNSIARDH